MEKQIQPGSVMESILVSLVQENWEYIQHIENPTETIQLAAISKNPKAIEYIDEPTQAAQHQAVVMNPDILDDLYVEDEEWFKELQLIAKIAKKELNILDITNPTPRCQWTAVYYDPMCIKDIPNPMKHIQLLAVSLNGYAIEYLPGADLEVQLAAVKQNAFAIQSIKKPCKEVQLEAVKNNGYVIKSIDNPDEDAQAMAVNDIPQLILDINNPCNAAQLIAVAKDVSVFAEMYAPDDNVKLLAVQKDGKMIQYIENPSVNLQLAAVLNDVEAIHHIDRPAEAVKITVISKNPLFVNILGNFEESTQRSILTENPSLYEGHENKFPDISVEEVNQLLKKKGHVSSKKKSAMNNFKGISIGAKWDSLCHMYCNDTFEINLAAFMIHAGGLCRTRNDIIYKGNVSGEGVSYCMAPKSEYPEQLLVDLKSVPDDVEKIVITATIFQGDKKHQTFGTVIDACVQVSENGIDIMNVELSNSFAKENGILLFFLSKKDGNWTITQMNDPFRGGIRTVASMYGI